MKGKLYKDRSTDKWLIKYQSGEFINLQFKDKYYFLDDSDKDTEIEFEIIKQCPKHIIQECTCSTEFWNVAKLIPFRDTMPPTLHPILYDKTNNRHLKYGGRYLIVRKDGKTHLETFNGTGFAYNDNSIKYYYLPPIS